ncbi:MAG: hypothetical protein IJ150_07510 [Bacteroidales bacterium]|nr:hypothetical protein [Bacteroidales bacterium]
MNSEIQISVEFFRNLIANLQELQQVTIPTLSIRNYLSKYKFSLIKKASKIDDNSNKDFKIIDYLQKSLTDFIRSTLMQEQIIKTQQLKESLETLVDDFIMYVGVVDPDADIVYNPDDVEDDIQTTTDNKDNPNDDDINIIIKRIENDLKKLKKICSKKHLN